MVVDLDQPCALAHSWRHSPLSARECHGWQGATCIRGTLHLSPWVPGAEVFLDFGSAAVHGVRSPVHAETLASAALLPGVFGFRLLPWSVSASSHASRDEQDCCWLAFEADAPTRGPSASVTAKPTLSCPGMMPHPYPICSSNPED